MEISAITLLQATQWDEGSKMPYKGRNKLCLEIWTVPEDEIKLFEPQWKRNVKLSNWAKFRNDAYKLHKRGIINQDHYDWIDVVTTKSNKAYHGFGMICDKGKRAAHEPGKGGTNYYMNQFVRAFINPYNEIEELVLLIHGDVLQVNGQVTTDCKGQSLRSKYTGQARLDLSDYAVGGLRRRRRPSSRWG